MGDTIFTMHPRDASGRCVQSARNDLEWNYFRFIQSWIKSSDVKFLVWHIQRRMTFAFRGKVARKLQFKYCQRREKLINKKSFRKLSSVVLRSFFFNNIQIEISILNTIYFEYFWRRVGRRNEKLKASNYKFNIFTTRVNLYRLQYRL